MPTRLIRKTVWSGIVVLASMLALSIAISLIAGSRLVGAGLQQELGALTGRRVQIAGDPTIRVFPALEAEFTDVSLFDWTSTADTPPLMRAPALRVKLAPIAALTGRVVITHIDLAAPVFNIETGRDWSGQLPIGTASRIGRAISALGASVLAAGETEAGPEPAVPALGEVVINDGTIQFTEAGTAVPNRHPVTGLDLTLDWPTASMPADLQGSAVWNGQAITFEASSERPSRLFAGVDAPVRLSLSGTPGTLQMAGTSRMTPAPYFTGTVALRAPSLPRLLAWTGVEIPLQTPETAITIDGTLTADSGKWSIDQLVLGISDTTARGALTYVPGPPPSVTGTLDFTTLNLTETAGLFIRQPDNEQASMVDDTLRLDMRLSAKTATAGPLQVSNVAATAQINPDMAAFDVNNASAFGGTVQLALKVGANGAGTELRLLADGIDTTRLKALTPSLARLPPTTVAASAILKGPSGDWRDFARIAQGTVKIRTQGGSFAGVNETRLIDDLRKGGFFSPSGGTGSLAFNEINMESTLADGTLTISRLKARLVNADADLAGAFSLGPESLALSGVLHLDATHRLAGGQEQLFRLFIGGSVDAPFVASIAPSRP